ncbi:efflux RND transporter periplasmic adaptor subunit [Parabacteroides pacaensis]|uniref:efflux RND transporter periplasmic adaptor subunit n=1 Tax=Parabacteroides pacaensis TaxID=2086575 RepID=UPI000D0E54F0|nr:efflux RND transporter periplasmic adaptor subunit [Parabacteroides pacaensis]
MKKLFFILAVAIVTSGCHNHASHEGHDHESEGHNHEAEEPHGHDHDHGEGEEHADEIIFKKAQAEAFGLEVKEIAPGPFHEVIKVSGQVLAAQGDETTQVAPVAGVVSFGRVAIVEGTNVRKGEALLSISAKNISEGDPVLKAKFAYETAKKEYERLGSLVKDKIVTEKDYNAARLNYETAKVAYEAVEGQYTANGQSVTAAMNGFIKSRLVNEGDYVQVGQPLVTLSQSNRLMLRAEVSAKYYPALSTIRSANFRTPYDNRLYKLADLNGRILTYGKSTDNASFYLPVTFDFDNKGAVIPGSYVEVYLISSPMENVLSIPLSALTEEEGAYFVYIQLDEEGYKKQEVTLGADNGSEVQILSGLKPGDRVVTKGAYQVRLASHSSVIPEGHTHNH